MGSVNRENIQQFCRACLRHLFHEQEPTMQQDKSIFYHVERTEDLNKWMAILNPLEDTNQTNNYQENQLYAKYVCQSCYENFKHIHDFREMVLHSYRVMIKLFSGTDTKKDAIPKHKEIQIKSERIDNDDEFLDNDDEFLDNDDEFLDNDDCETGNNEGGSIRKEDFLTTIDLTQNVEEENDEEVNDDDICKELEIPSVTTNLPSAEDNIKVEPEKITEPSVDVLQFPSRNGIDGQPKAVKSYKCPICKNSYINRNTYLTHIRQMHLTSEHSIECEICHKKYTKFFYFCRHLRLVHSESPRQYKCEYKNCNRSFRQLVTRRKHYEKMHNCEAFHDQKSVLSYKFLRNKENPYAKHFISNNFQSTSKNSINSESEAPSINKRLPICPLCSTAFETSYNLKVHMNESHKDDLKFHCHICGKHKISQMKLDEHIATAHNNFRVKCDNCQKLFKSKSHLRQHILAIHSGIKPYACEYCPSTFATKNNLKMHTRIHTGEKPFKCHVCDRPFTRESSMKKHLEIHERERRNTATEVLMN